MPGTRAKFDAFTDLMLRAKGLRIRVGVFRGEAGGTSELVEVATHHEFGAPAANIPERSFIRSTIAERKPEMQVMIGRVVKHMIAGRIKEREALGLVGAFLANAIKSKISHGPFAPLKPATIARKKSDKPLIDTAQMMNAVTFIIVP